MQFRTLVALGAAAALTAAAPTPLDHHTSDQLASRETSSAYMHTRDTACAEDETSVVVGDSAMCFPNDSDEMVQILQHLRGRLPASIESRQLPDQKMDTRDDAPLLVCPDNQLAFLIEAVGICISESDDIVGIVQHLRGRLPASVSSRKA